MAAIDTVEEREKIPLEDYGDPDNRAYPITTQEQLDSAATLYGKASDPEKLKTRIIEIAKRKGLTLPESWQEEAEHSEFALFAGPAQAPKGYVFKSGLIFEAGKYPDKDFELSPEELKEAAAKFKPVPVDLEHIDTVLDGKLGKLESVEARNDGKELWGTVAIPEWLNKAVGETKIKVSCTWDKATKTLEKLALVLKPRVKNAAIMAAFSAQNNQDQEKKKKKEKEKDYIMATKKDFQDIHDHAVKLGAKCFDDAERKEDGTRLSDEEEEMKARYAGARNSKADQEHIQGLHDHSAEMGARCFADNPNGLVKRLEADREEEAEKEAKAKKVNHSEQPDVASFAVELAQMKAAKEKLETQVAEMRRDTLRKEAAAFADEMVADHRAFPVEKKGLVELYLQAAFDDETGTKATALVSFGETKQPVNRVEALKIQYSTRPSHGMLTEEVIRAVEDPESEEARKFGILPAQRAAASASKGGKISAERRNHLLGLTPVGQSVLENGK